MDKQDANKIIWQQDAFDWQFNTARLDSMLSFLNETRGGVLTKKNEINHEFNKLIHQLKDAQKIINNELDIQITESDKLVELQKVAIQQVKTLTNDHMEKIELEFENFKKSDNLQCAKEKAQYVKEQLIPVQSAINPIINFCGVDEKTYQPENQVLPNQTLNNVEKPLNNIQINNNNKNNNEFSLFNNKEGDKIDFKGEDFLSVLNKILIEKNIIKKDESEDNDNEEDDRANNNNNNNNLLGRKVHRSEKNEKNEKNHERKPNRTQRIVSEASNKFEKKLNYTINKNFINDLKKVKKEIFQRLKNPSNQIQLAFNEESCWKNGIDFLKIEMKVEDETQFYPDSYLVKFFENYFLDMFIKIDPKEMIIQIAGSLPTQIESFKNLMNAFNTQSVALKCKITEIYMEKYFYLEDIVNEFKDCRRKMSEGKFKEKLDDYKIFEEIRDMQRSIK